MSVDDGAPTHSLGQEPCATTVAIAWQGKWQKHFLLHKSLAICVSLGVLSANEVQCNQEKPYWRLASSLVKSVSCSQPECSDASILKFRRGKTSRSDVQQRKGFFANPSNPGRGQTSTRAAQCEKGAPGGSEALAVLKTGGRRRLSMSLHRQGRICAPEGSVAFWLKAQAYDRTIWTVDSLVEDIMSLCSSPGSEEKSPVIHLILITFAGEEIQLIAGIRQAQ